jgi:AcrR family transcriptional regulator
MTSGQRQECSHVTTEPVRHLGPWERRRLRTSLEIERAGLELVRERGVQHVTVEQVAAAASISTRTFFRFFRNVPDLLTAVPAREVERTVRQVMARPAEEGVVDAFRAVFEQRDRGEMDYDDAELEEATLALWSDIVRQEPESVAAHSHALAVMVNRYEELARARLRLQGREDDDDTAGLLASALAGVIWFVFVGWVNEGHAGSLASKLETAFKRLHHLIQP